MFNRRVYFCVHKKASRGTFRRDSTLDNGCVSGVETLSMTILNYCRITAAIGTLTAENVLSVINLYRHQTSATKSAGRRGLPCRIRLC